MSDDYEPDFDDDCPKCGSSDREWDQCWYCHGDGGWHDCGDDCCPCLHKDINVSCPECGGKGGYMVCYGCVAKAEEEEAALRSDGRTEGEEG